MWRSMQIIKVSKNVWSPSLILMCFNIVEVYGFINACDIFQQILENVCLIRSMIFNKLWNPINISMHVYIDYIYIHTHFGLYITKRKLCYRFSMLSNTLKIISRNTCTKKKYFHYDFYFIFEVLFNTRSPLIIKGFARKLQFVMLTRGRIEIV